MYDIVGSVHGHKSAACALLVMLLMPGFQLLQWLYREYTSGNLEYMCTIPNRFKFRERITNKAIKSNSIVGLNSLNVAKDDGQPDL